MIPERIFNSAENPEPKTLMPQLGNSIDSQVYIKNDNGIIEQVVRIKPRQNSKTLLDIEYIENEGPFSGYGQ